MTGTAYLQDCVAEGSLKQKCLQSLEVSMLPLASLPWALPACCSQHPAVPPPLPPESSPLPTFPRHPPQLSDVSRDVAGSGILNRTTVSPLTPGGENTWIYSFHQGIYIPGKGDIQLMVPACTRKCPSTSGYTLSPTEGCMQYSSFSPSQDSMWLVLHGMDEALTPYPGANSMRSPTS